MKQDPNHIFTDTNVLIGAYSDNQYDKRCLQYLFSLRGKRLYISSLGVAQLVSVQRLRKIYINAYRAMKTSIANIF